MKASKMFWILSLKKNVITCNISFWFTNCLILNYDRHEFIGLLRHSSSFHSFNQIFQFSLTTFKSLKCVLPFDPACFCYPFPKPHFNQIKQISVFLKSPVFTKHFFFFFNASTFIRWMSNITFHPISFVRCYFQKLIRGDTQKFYLISLLSATLDFV